MQLARAPRDPVWVLSLPEIVMGKPVWEAHDSAELPVAGDSVDERVHVFAEMAVAAEGQIVNDVGVLDVRDIVEAGAPFRFFVVQVLPVR